MANQFGIDMGQVYQTTEAVKGSRQTRQNNALKMDWAKEDRTLDAENRKAARQRTQHMNALRNRVAQGGPDAAAAERELIAFAPEEARQVQEAFANMDERQRKLAQENVETLGRTSAFILGGETPEEQAARYAEARANMAPEVAANMPEEYNPNWVQMQMAKAREMDDMLQNPELITVGGEDRLYRDGQMVETTDSNALLRAQASGSDDGGVKSADESLMFRQAGELLGGIFDQSGNLQNLDPSTRSKVQSIATEAANLFSNGQASSRAQAVTMAARKLNIDIEDISNVEPGQSVTRRRFNAETGTFE